MRGKWRHTRAAQSKITTKRHSNWIVLKSLGMFPLHRGVRFVTIAESRATSLSPQFHKCNADNDVIIPPCFLSSRSSWSSSSFCLPRRARVPFMSPASLSCTLRLVSPSPRRADITHREFQRLLQFPLNRISFNNEIRERTTQSRSLLLARCYVRRGTVRTGDAYRSRLFQLSFPFLGLADDDTSLRSAHQDGMRDSCRVAYHAC